MSIFEDPNTTAVDDAYRYFKKSVFGEDSGSDTAAEGTENVSQVVYPADDTSSKLEMNVIANMSNVMWYPEEVAFQNNRNSPPNVIKFSIKDYSGASLDTQKFIREFGNNTLKPLLNDRFGKTWRGLQELNSGGNTQFVEGWESATDPSGSLLDPEAWKQAGNTTVKVWENTSTGKPLEADKTLATIFMYAPGDNTTHYRMEYTDEDLSDINKVIDLTKAVLGQGSANVATDVLRQAGVSVLSSILDKAGGLVNLNLKTKDFLQSKTRLIPVENWEYLFRRVQRRNFSYTFKMYPKSLVEIQNVAKIIAAFKYYAHPAKLEDSRYLTAPSVFKIENLIYDGRTYKENVFVNRIKPCALRAITLTYTEGGGFSTLNADLLANKAMSQLAMNSTVGIAMTLDFSELNIITRDDLTAVDDLFNGKMSEKGYH